MKVPKPKYVKRMLIREYTAAICPLCRDEIKEYGTETRVGAHWECSCSKWLSKYNFFSGGGKRETIRYIKLKEKIKKTQLRIKGETKTMKKEKEQNELRALVSAGGWSYVINQNENALRITLEGYGSCTPQNILQEWLNNLPKEVRKKISNECDERKDVVD